MQFTGRGAALETIRFAGANRLLIRFTYNYKARTVEPYSLRRPATGNLLLYGWERESSQLKAFNLDKITDLSVTHELYTARYTVELTSIPPHVSTPHPRVISPRRAQVRRTSGSRSGSRYIVQCMSCGKRFYRDKYATKIGKHKAKGGWGTCSGRTGFVVGMT